MYTTLDIRDVAAVTVVERLYYDTEIRDALSETGFDIVAVMEAHTWDEPTSATERIEYIACPGNGDPYRLKFPDIRDQHKATLPIR